MARDNKLAMADAIVYATAVDMGADVLACDAHFSELAHVLYLAKGAR
jgi:predicted nucleic acid-binding protein